MKTKLFVMVMLAGGSLFAETHISIGVGIGTPGYYYAAPPPPVVAYAPPRYYRHVWVPRHWNGWRWVPGHWG